MLVLPVVRRGDLLVLADADDAARGCALCARPRLARREDGSPRLRLLRWVAPAAVGGGPPAAGRLSLDVSVAPTGAELAAAGLDAAAPATPPWLAASVKIDGPGFETLEVEAGLADDSLAAIDVDLTAAAAAFLAPLLQGDVVSPLQVSWTGYLRVRLPEVEVLATVEVDEVSRRSSTVRGAVRRDVIRSIVDANARIKISGSTDPQLEEALRAWVLDELTERFNNDDELVVRAAAADVVRWPITVSSTLDDLIAPEQRARLVEEIFLEPDEVGAAPPVEVRVLADFAGRVERVDVQLEDPAAGDVVDVVFTDETPHPAILHAARFRWRARHKLTAGATTAWSEWEGVERSYGLVVPIRAPAELAIEVVAAGLDFQTRWSSVRVALQHVVAGEATASHVVELDAGRRSARWSQPLTGERGEVRAHLTFRSQRGLVLESDVAALAGDELVVSDPFAGSRVQRALLPTGSGWEEVASAMVDLRYADGPYSHQEAVEMRGLDDFVQWQVPARPDGPEAVEWRLHASFTDGRFESTGWQSSAAAVLPLSLAGAPRRDVQVLPVYFDAAVTARIEVHLSSGARSAAATFTDRTPQTVILPPGPYRWQATWFPLAGGPLAGEQQDGDEDVIVLPRPPA